MNVINKMGFSLTVLLLAAWGCLAEVSYNEERMTRSASASSFPSLRSRRMIRGKQAPHVPWQAMVYLSDTVVDGGYAGGALISDRWVLTAGRNVFVRKSRQDIQGKAPVIPKVYLGILRRNEADATKEVEVERIVLHPGFQNHSDWDNDLALIQLKKPVVMSDKVTPIPLPEAGQDLADAVGGLGVITGWGWGMFLSSATSLKHLTLALADHSACRREYDGMSLTPDVDDNMFCTGPARYEENVCFGDAGGALAVTDAATGDIYAAGILSYDKSCSRYPYGVYMKLSSYLPWIHSVIRGDTENSFSLRTNAMSKMFLQP
ncbi:haptoglobin-like [Seriola lalandi dorsalis]|uniref:Haptoglobin-like n=1 Tax=Seriola lalandi dorsalis TaxID=1841481 RepID=A0A3B4YHV8_SERLL|nr:haptoglobin-like [Seriola lalandi dorsalis]